MASIDAGTLTRITGVALVTFNAWAQRGLVPGVEMGTKGRPREFDLAASLHVAVMAELVSLGYGPSFAAMAAATALEKGIDTPGARLIIGPPRRNVYNLGMTPTIDYTVAKTPKSLSSFLDTFTNGRPTSYTIIELDRLHDRVKQAFENPDLAERARRQRGVSDRRSARRDMMEPEPADAD